MRFFDFLFPPRVDELALRDVSLDTFLAHLNPRLVPDTRPGTVALLPFHAPSVRAAIHEAKYHGSERAYEYLAHALAEYLRGADDISKPILVPIPLGKERLRERGFNQAEEIVRRAAVILGGAAVNTTLLLRIRETASQVSLPRHEREKNMRGAFACLPAERAPVEPAATYIIVDDVITTGATLAAALSALQEAGAGHIIPIALAH